MTNPWIKALKIAAVIAAILIIYLQFVNKDRDASLKKYFDTPQAGDIYKIRYDDKETGFSSVRYFKIADFNENTVFFFRSKMSSRNISDLFLGQYDESATIGFSRQNLLDIKAGIFFNNEMLNAKLLEIERR
jgi:hypothetical protein